jgi:hypothetical protein
LRALARCGSFKNEIYRASSGKAYLAATLILSHKSGIYNEIYPQVGAGNFLPLLFKNLYQTIF